LRLLPEELTIVASAGREPLAGAWVRATLTMTRKNDFNLLVGPTDSEGRVIATRADLTSQMTQIRDLFLMDYAGPEAWDGSIRVAVLSRDDVETALSAFDVWGTTVGIRSQSELQQFRQFETVLKGLEGQEFHVDVFARPSGAAVVVEEMNLA
jgi:hypothetical protein